MREPTDATSDPGHIPMVSVIIPTCGRPQMVLDCVASILRNDLDDFEIIIIDQDRAGTLRAEISQRFNGEQRLVYVPLEEPSASRARNLGINHARGEILVFSDDDTEVDPGWLRAYVDAFAACSAEPVVIGGRLDPLWLSPKPGWLPAEKEYLLGIYNKHDGFMLLPEADQPIGANFAAHRKVVDAVGPFDERIGPSYARKRAMIFGEDALFSLRARQAHYPVYHQAAARSWHKMPARKVTKAYFLRRSFWEGVTQVTILHLSGSAPAEHWRGIVRWHSGEVLRWTRRLAGTLVHWRRRANPAQDAMEAVSSIAQSAGTIRAALKLRSTGRLPW
jgi:glycosyltransferase involved in cell wall biosynthesis